VQDLRLEVDNCSIGSPPERQQSVRVEYIDQELRRPLSASFGVFLQDTLVGTSFTAPTPDVPGWYALFSVAVRPNFRGKKLSRGLLQQCVEHAQSAGASGITLVVNVPNPEAKALYDSFGFEVWNTLEHAYVCQDVRYSQLTMRKFLNGQEA
jgi:ribosomal protein S18 acetylase RimI-like enzyme